jgi:hypothetical protein
MGRRLLMGIGRVLMVLILRRWPGWLGELEPLPESARLVIRRCELWQPCPPPDHLDNAASSGSYVGRPRGISEP